MDISTFTGGLLATNSYFLPTREGRGVLVDAPEGAAEWLEGKGFAVQALLLTHHHFDHIQGVAAVVSAHGCPVYAFSPLSKELTLEGVFGGFSGISLEISPFVVDHLLEGEQRLELAGLEFRLFHVPGHSADSLCFYHEKSADLFGGDVLMAGGLGRSDFPGSDGELLVWGIREKIFPLEDAVRVWPGHGPVTTIGEERRNNPYCGDRQ